MLSQDRRSSWCWLRIAWKFERAVYDRNLTERLMLCVDHHLACDRLRLCKRLFDPQDRCVRHLMLRKQLDELIHVLLNGDRRNTLVDCATRVASFLQSIEPYIFG